MLNRGAMLNLMHLGTARHAATAAIAFGAIGSAVTAHAGSVLITAGMVAVVFIRAPAGGLIATRARPAWIGRGALHAPIAADHAVIAVLTTVRLVVSRHVAGWVLHAAVAADHAVIAVV